MRIFIILVALISFFTFANSQNSFTPIIVDKSSTEDHCKYLLIYVPSVFDGKKVPKYISLQLANSIEEEPDFSMRSPLFDSSEFNNYTKDGYHFAEVCVSNKLLPKLDAFLRYSVNINNGSVDLCGGEQRFNVLGAM